MATTHAMDVAQQLVHLIAEDSAVTAIEYGLLAALIAVVIIAAVSATGTSLTAIYNYWAGAVSAAL